MSFVSIGHAQVGNHDTIVPQHRGNINATPPQNLNTAPLPTANPSGQPNFDTNHAASANPGVPTPTAPNSVGTVAKTDTSKNQTPVLAKDTSKTLQARFTKPTIILDNEDIVSNVLLLFNNTDIPVDFTVNINSPFGWTQLESNTTKYHMNPKDSLYLPVHVIPGEIKGGAEYVINAYIVATTDGSQLANGYFFAHTKRIVKWDINVFPDHRIYFRNGEDTASFRLSILNEGNQPDDLLVTVKNFKNKSLLMDSTGRLLKSNFYNVSLRPLSDTSMAFKVKYVGTPVNFRYQDVENFTPDNSHDPQSFNVWLTTQEARQTDSNIYMKGKEVEFIKLSDETHANPFGGQAIPLTVDLNAYNIFGAQPVMNLLLYGNTFLDNDARIFYTGNMFFTSYNWQNNLFRSSSFYAGYFDKRGDDIQVGDIGASNSSGLALGGRGIKGDYAINNNNVVGAMVADAYGFNTLDFEAWYRHKFVGLTPILNGTVWTTSGGGYDNNYQNIKAYFVSESGGINITQDHHISFIVDGLDKIYPNTNFIGGSYFVNYSGNMIHHKLSQSDYFYRGSYDTNATAKNITAAGNYTTYRLNQKWQFQLQDQYNSYPSPYDPVTPTTFSFSNYLYAVRSFKGSGVAPFIFFNRYNSNNTELAYYGAGERYNYFNVDKNLLLSEGIQGGYNSLLNYPSIKPYFTVQPNLLLRYHTNTLRFYYSYGPLGVPIISEVDGNAPYPQEITAAFSNQYQFRNKHFIWENSLTYSYFNVYYDHSLTYSPELYYFTNSGWRFKIGFDYSFNSSNVSKADFYLFQVPNENLDNSTPMVTNNIFLNMGVKKTFGIPIPKKWQKYFYKNITFIAFLDLNGDGKKEMNESPVDNLVIHISDNKTGTFEALTNDEGTARILNLKVDNYSMSTIPLRNMKEWFITIPDSLDAGAKDTVYVPFVKGVKIFGSVVYHPAKFSVYPKIDLTGIQVTATNENGKSYSTLTNPNGEFAIYAPIGKYTITMNEEWMDDRFKVAQNNFNVTLTPGIGNLYQSFYISEKSTGAEIKNFNQPAPTNPPDEVPH